MTGGDPDPPPVINCTNGELWSDENGQFELKPHEPESFLRSCMDVNFDPHATCPTYKRVEKEIFAKCEDQPAMVRFWHDLMGYAIQPRRPNAKILMLWGSGSNGKTKLIETLTRLLGQSEVMAMPVGNLGDSRFAMAGLLGKYIFLDDDVKTGTKLSDGILKQISEEKLISSDTKNGEYRQFKCRVLPILLFNNPPLTNDVSDGFQRRLIVVPFDRKFDQNHPMLFEPIWTTEMSGVLNLYLEGLGRVIRNGWVLQPPAELAHATTRLLRGANPVPEYVGSRCQQRADYSEQVSILFEDYRAWAAGNGTKHIIQRKDFIQNLLGCGFRQQRKSAGDYMVGLKLKVADAFCEL